jgi:hypothetical protein
MNPRDERGLAMVMTVVIMLVAAMLAAVILTQGTSVDRHSGRGKNWNQALQNADAGVEQAIAALQAGNGAVPAPMTQATVDGSYQVTVQYLGRNRYQIDSIGSVGTVSGLAAERHVRVIMAPPKSFKFALFSLSSVDTKNNNLINGDVWAMGEVTVQGGDKIDGSVTSATGWLVMEQNSEITGDVHTGGSAPNSYAVDGRKNGTKIGGNVKASSTSPDCADDAGHSQYRVDVGTISGNLTTWGAIANGQSDSAKLFTNTCTDPPSLEPFPQFIYNPANYNPAPVTFADASAFQTYINANKSNMKGTFVVGGSDTDPNNFVDITGIKVSGDLTIIANGPITADQGSAAVEAANQDEKLLVLVSYYRPIGQAACQDNGGNPGDCAIGVKNNFAPDGSDNTATLVYAPNGPVAFKNNAEFLGAVYASNIVLKNNQTTTYDPRVEQIVGFGPVTLEQESWQELSD